MTRMILCILAMAPWLSACGDNDSGQNDNRNQNGNTATAICGNGVVEAGEQCDDGELNSDLASDACRTNCRFYHCGDGIVDSSEECDEGGSNSDLLPNACRSNCQSAACGDGVVDSGEECDEGADNSDTEPGACRTNCLLPACEDGVADPGQICYAFWDVAWPYGFLTPLDVDEDGLVDLVGPASENDRIYLHARNEGAGLAYGRGHLVTAGSSMMVLPGNLVSGSSRPDLLVGGSPPMVASVTAEGRLALPAALPVKVPESWPDNRLMVAGVVGPTGDRYVGWGHFDAGNANYCVAEVDAAGLLVPESRSCQTLEPLRGAYDYPPRTALVLPTSTGTSVLALLQNQNHPDTIAPLSLIHLDAQARAVNAETPTLPYGLLWLGSARADNADTYLVTYAGTVVEYRKWNPQTAAFDPSSASIPIPDVWAAQMTTPWQLSASSSWKDLAFVDQNENLRVFAYDALSEEFQETVTCALPYDQVHQILAVDLDADQDEDLVVVGRNLVSMTNQFDVMVLWNTGQQIDCSANTTVFERPGEPYLSPMLVAHVDGDAYPDIIFSNWDGGHDFDPVIYGTEMLRGGPSPTFSKIALYARPSYLAALPAGTNEHDLVFSTLSGSGQSLVGLARMVSGDFETGKPVVTSGADPFVGVAQHQLVVDVNDDAHSDVLLVTSDQRLHVYRGPYDDASGGFASHHLYDLPYQPGFIVAADLSGDGLPDLIMVRGNPVETPNSPDNLVTVIENDAGEFDTTPRQFETDFDPGVLALGRFNADNHLDVATVHVTAGTVVVLLNDGSGGLVRSERKSIPGEPVTAVATDLDGDGHLDLAVSTPDNGMGPVWLRGMGDGTFGDAVDLDLTASEFLTMNIDNTGSTLADLLVVKQRNGEFITVIMQAIP